MKVFEGFESVTINKHKLINLIHEYCSDFRTYNFSDFGKLKKVYRCETWFLDCKDYRFSFRKSYGRFFLVLEEYAYDEINECGRWKHLNTWNISPYCLICLK